ncbi:MAG: RcnB family protein [Phenylobacterium sp.]|uniref:RcnB family protein n=1 Tax=Phenylobacterium sp. TaxID=1871053 RepID=UPI001A597A3F|nr:RcnB family protein [Phenylobacterium sp.]MBL8772616.1 RcnB family protein [Phenylobacterium sp.]
MRRLFLMIAAAVCVAAPLGDVAWSQGRGDGDRRGGRAERQDAPADRGARRGGDERRDWGDRRRFDERRAGPPRGRWVDDGGPPRPAPPYEGRRRYEDGPRPAFAPSGARRGGYLPDRFRGGVVEDYRRYRLRPPPSGYAWVRVGSGFALVSESSGQIFDIIPD